MNGKEQKVVDEMLARLADFGSMKKIKDKTWKVKYKEEAKKEETLIVKPEVIKIGSEKKDTDEDGSLGFEDEIKKAIEKIRN